MKGKEPDNDENVVLCRALRDFNLPKITTQEGDGQRESESAGRNFGVLQKKDLTETEGVLSTLLVRLIQHTGGQYECLQGPRDGKMLKLIARHTQGFTCEPRCRLSDSCSQ